MSHSRKRTPIIGITSATSEKADKVAAHRRERRCVRQALEVAPGQDLLPHTRELSNVWIYAKDGKQFVRRARPADLRK